MLAAAVGTQGGDGSCLETNRTERLVFSSTADYQVKRWLTCAPAADPSLHEFTDGGRGEWREPPLASLCCGPKPDRCFRGVFDQRILLATELQLEDSAANCSERAMRGECSSDSETMRAECALACKGYSEDEALQQQISALLQEEFGVSAQIEVSASRGKTYTKSSERGQHTDDPWEGLHADYLDRKVYVYSAVLFLDLESDDDVKRKGGQTGLADKLDSEKKGLDKLVSGWIVEPRKGRLVVFSGGGENYHTPLPVTQGRRTTFHAWFTCSCPKDPSLTESVVMGGKLYVGLY